MTQETEDVVGRMIELGAKQLYKDFENTTAEHADLIFSSEDAECTSLANEMREWFRAAVEASGLLPDDQSLSDRIDVLEGALKPFADKAAAVERDRKMWNPSLGPVADGFTVAVSLGKLRRARASLRTTHREGSDAK